MKLDQALSVNGDPSLANNEDANVADTDRARIVEPSLLQLGARLLRGRNLVARWGIVGAFVAAIVVAFKPAVYVASASFLPQGGDSPSSNLASIAGQFGVLIPTSSQSTSPDFYAKLLTSRVLLEPIVHDTFVVSMDGQRRVPFLQLFEIEEQAPARMQERGVTVLKDAIAASVAKATGMVEVSVRTRWPEVSLAILKLLIRGVNEFNVTTRQSQAIAERKFVDSRLVVAKDELRGAEERLAEFLSSNRQFGASPELSLTRDRLQRDVSFRQQIVTTLAQASEDVRIREVRDTPVITVVETPESRSVPEPRGRLKGVLLGLLLGAFVGCMLALTRGAIKERRGAGYTDANDFLAELGATKREMATPLRWIRRRVFRERVAPSTNHS